MNRHRAWRWLALYVAAVTLDHGGGAHAVANAQPPADPADRRPPNIIFMLCDDLAQGDVGCFGQTKIQTPNIDRLAAEGTKFPQCYAGTTVCAPSRCALMTGLHMGHAPIRANREVQPEGQMPLPAGTLTVAQVLKTAGYATACTGKWGLGMFETSGSPLKTGFDHFFGYNCQRRAHNYFPSYLYHDDRRRELDGKTYSQNLIGQDTLAWVRQHKDQPFFLYYAITLPHGEYKIDDMGEYAHLDWNLKLRIYAAMVTRLDTELGRLLDLLQELQIDEHTVIFFAGDNGSSFPPESEVGRFFNQPTAAKLRGSKRTMYEGGLRQCGLVRWPGRVPAGHTNQTPWAFWDFLPTAAALAGAVLPDGANLDGRSIVDLLQGGPPPQRDYFYWELHEPHFQQAVRQGDWKAVRPAWESPVELYDLKNDSAEAHDVAREQPDVVARLSRLLQTARDDDPRWPIRTAHGAP